MQYPSNSPPLPGPASLVEMPGIQIKHWKLWEPIFRELERDWAFQTLGCRANVVRCLRRVAKGDNGNYEETFTSSRATVRIEFIKMPTRANPLMVLSVVLLSGTLSLVATRSSLTHANESVKMSSQAVADGGDPTPICSHWNVLGELRGHSVLERCCPRWEVFDTNTDAIMSLSQYEKDHLPTAVQREMARLNSLAAEADRRRRSSSQLDAEEMFHLRQEKDRIENALRAVQAENESLKSALEGMSSQNSSMQSSPQGKKNHDMLDMQVDDGEDDDESHFATAAAAPKTEAKEGNKEAALAAELDKLKKEFMALKEEMDGRNKTHESEVARFRETLEAQQKENETTMAALAAKNDEVEEAREEVKSLQAFKSRVRPLVELLSYNPSQDMEPTTPVTRSSKRARRD
ncbi:hypothetical protein ACRALDRAFT_205929 [Sodiomyces alcalophilus JCM 7366]|uniref:uncharacterized protein n=1 Tax=Sodiomyces alcalophilus JCM 7366 TaxID=591952 RepID=UPI0039B4B496